VVGERSMGPAAGGVTSVCEDGVSAVEVTKAGWEITFRSSGGRRGEGVDRNEGDGEVDGRGAQIMAQQNLRELEPLCSGCTLRGRDGDSLLYRFHHRRMFPLQVAALRTSTTCVAS